MKKFDYEKVGKEIGWNFSKINPTVEHLSDYNYYQKVVEAISPKTIMLDIGCGSGEKALRYFSLAKKIYETDLEPEMLKKAQANAKKYYENDEKFFNKFEFKIMNGDENFSFPDESFDLVVSRHCGANMNEVYRVLKKGGIFISEDISFNDCQELKDVFKRGQGYNRPPLYKQTMNNCIEAGFSKIEFLRFEEIEFYHCKEELKFLLTHTPILGVYEEENDDVILEKYLEQFTTDKGIQLNRRLYAFYLEK